MRHIIHTILLLYRDTAGSFETHHAQGTDLSTSCERIYLTINDKYIPMTAFVIKFEEEVEII